MSWMTSGPIQAAAAGIFLVACASKTPVGLAGEQGEWRMLSQQESSGTWRQKYPDRALKITEDFDGDGAKDEAYLRVNSVDASLGLFVSLSRAASDRRPLLVEQFPGAKLSEGGISVALPGTYQTACAKGRANCGPGESPVVTFTSPGIELFEFESSHLVYYWDNIGKTFKKEWLSD